MQNSQAASSKDRIEAVIDGLRRLTEFYFQLVTVLILAGLIDATARANPKVQGLHFAAVITVWAVLLWTVLHLVPIIYRFMAGGEPKPVERYLSWVLATAMAVMVATTCISPLGALASGLVK